MRKEAKHGVTDILGCVTPAEQLMVIVPNGQPLEVEALVLNRDIVSSHSSS